MDSVEPPDGPAAFYEALGAGADCARLFELRNRLDPKDPARGPINEELRRVGCHTSSSARTDPPPDDETGQRTGTAGADVAALSADMRALAAAATAVKPEHEKMRAVTVEALSMIVDAELALLEAGADLRRRARPLGAAVPPLPPRPDLTVVEVAVAALKAHQGRLSPGGRETLKLLEGRAAEIRGGLA